MVGLVAIAKRGQPTHTIGVGDKGMLRFLDDLDIPPHPFFKPGSEYPIYLRHGQVDAIDDAISAFRSASFRLGPINQPSLFGLTMNTGERSIFYTGNQAVDLFKAKGAAGNPHDPNGDMQPWIDFFSAYPEAFLSVQEGGLRRAPTSFTHLAYYYQPVQQYHAENDHLWFVRFRLIPHDRRPDTDGLLSTVEQQAPWIQARLPQETRPTNYLRQAFKQQLAEEAIGYWLQIQFHDSQPADAAEVYHAGIPWDTTTHPWHDLAQITLTDPLADETLEHLDFNPFVTVPGLDYPPARSMDDYKG